LSIVNKQNTQISTLYYLVAYLSSSSSFIRDDILLVYGDNVSFAGLK